MAMTYATSSSAMFAASHSNRSPAPVLFLSSPMASKRTIGARANRSFQIRCQEQKVQKRNLAPVEQRWMFTDSDFTGPLMFVA
ncbi:hypothetical protein SSX86_016687 [Deinandra increscens subsp. villosa]|uniref:Uncharacterized protein n=1 Tax=Deinandra increscens subsp. villosa TaxID=3103831 RepID=A0AAP0D5Y4_9ASTR